MFQVLGDLGTGMLVIRDIARDKRSTGKYLANYIPIKITLSFFMFASIFAVINLLHYPNDTTVVVYIIGLSLALSQLSSALISIFHAYERMEFSALLGVVERAVIVSLGIPMLFLGYGLTKLVFVFLVGSIVKLMLSLFIVSKIFIKPKIEVDLTFWKQMLQQSLPFWVHTVFVSIYFYIDTVMLSLMKGDEVVGWYSAAYNLLSALIFIPAMFTASIFPVFSQFFKDSINSLKKSYEKSVKYMLIISLPIAVGTTIIADKIIWFIFTEKFTESILALKILIWAFPIIALKGILHDLLGAIEKQNVLAKTSALGAILNVGLNALMIPRLSLYGAAIATVITELFTLLFYYRYAPGITKLPTTRHSRVFISVIMMAFCTYIIRGYNLAVIISISAIVYFMMLYVTGYISKEDLSLIRYILMGEKTNEVKRP